jgi:hypothetical protein
VTRDRLVAAAGLLALAAVAVIFRGRLAADFWPLDSSRVGPNLVASGVIAVPAFAAGALLRPVAARAAHRFVDAKLASVHARQDAHHDLLQRIAEHVGLEDEQ